MKDIAAKKEAERLLNSINENTTFDIKLEKDKDKRFVHEYNITYDEVEWIVNNLPINQFRSKIKCEDLRYNNVDYLYDFKSFYSCVDIYGLDTAIPIYVKIGKDNLTNNTIVVVSLHEDE
ncbi:MAG TPA: hypothetical protein DCE23_00630 [Firmicutes bacterium]|nr:hypothetical protein [Bacillota bacterium]